MGARRHDAPAVEQDHRVGERDGSGAVRDHDGGATVHHGRHGRADLVLLRRVDRGRGVVEDQHPWVGKNGSGDRDALPLATRQRESTLTEHRVVRLRESHDEVVGAGKSRCPFDGVVGGVGLSEGDVRGDRVVEQQRVLEHDADRTTNVMQ